MNDMKEGFIWCLIGHEKGKEILGQIRIPGGARVSAEFVIYGYYHPGHTDEPK